MSKATVDKHSGVDKMSTTSSYPFIDKAHKDKVAALEREKQALTHKTEEQALEIGGLKVELKSLAREIDKQGFEIHAIKKEIRALKEARGEGDGSLKASGPGKFKQTIPDILLVSFTVASTNQDLDQNENNAAELDNPVTGQWHAINRR